MRLITSLVATLVFVGCPGPTASVDGGTPRGDAGAVDVGGQRDAGASPSVPDGGTGDAGTLDVSGLDGSVLDGGAADAGPYDAGAAFDAGPGDAGPRLTVTRQFVDGGPGIPIELLTLEAPGRAVTYAQWMPVRLADGGAAPVVVLTKPYDGIAWPNDPIDRRWAALGPGAHPDFDGPDGGAGATSIVYAPISVSQQAGEAELYRIHGISTLFLYGRFYAGGSIQNDVDDMVTGLDFLALEPHVDRTRIGIHGGSWGGFLSVYGAAYAPADATPRVGTALYPLTDFAEEWRFITVTMPSRLPVDAGQTFARFFDPYVRRIVASTGGPPDGGAFMRFDLNAIATRLRTPFFIYHEDWDALVNVEQTQALALRRPDLIRSLIVRHDAPPTAWDLVGVSHGPLTGQFGNDGVFTFVWATLLLELSSAPVVYVPWSEPPFTALLIHARDRTRAGTSHDTLAGELSRLVDPRVQMFELTTQAIEPGPAFVSRQLNTLWGASTTPQTVGAVLAGGLPP